MSKESAGVQPRRMIGTLVVGVTGGLGFYLLDLPLPWVLGSLTAAALTALATSFRPALPRGCRTFAMVAVGTMLGTGFTREVVRGAGAWIPSLIVMSLLSLTFFALAYQMFRRIGGMQPLTAMFAAMPGGLSVVSMLAEEYRAETGRIVLCHTARLVALLITAPIVIQWLSGIDLAEANRMAFSNVEPINLTQHCALAFGALLAWLAGRWMKLPSGALLLPLIVSASLHATGIVTVHVPPLLSITAQLIIGSGVGARFADYSLRELGRDGILAGLVGVLLAAGALGASTLMAPFTGIDAPALLLAYLPGGAPELGVVALALMIDPAMVAAHHVLRVFLMVGALPVAARHFDRSC